MNETNCIDADVTLRFGEILRANIYIAIRTMLILYLMIAAAFMLLIVYKSVLFFCLLVGWSVLGMLVSVLTQTQVTYARNRKIAPSTHFHLSAEAFETSTLLGSNKLAWSIFRKVRETGEAFLFFYNPKIAIVFPKRCLADEFQIHALRTLVVAQCGAKAKLR
jgi:YcxB-like protein